MAIFVLVSKSLDLVLSGWILTTPTIFIIPGGVPGSKLIEYGNTINAYNLCIIRGSLDEFVTKARLSKVELKFKTM